MDSCKIIRSVTIHLVAEILLNPEPQATDSGNVFACGFRRRVNQVRRTDTSNAGGASHRNGKIMNLRPEWPTH